MAFHQSPYLLVGGLNWHCKALNSSLCSVNLLDSWATASTWWGTTTEATSRHATLWHAATATCRLVHLHHDGVDNALKFFLLRLKLVLLSKLVLVKPVECLLHCLLNLIFVPTFELILKFLFIQCVPHGEAIVFQPILG